MLAAGSTILSAQHHQLPTYHNSWLLALAQQHQHQHQHHAAGLTNIKEGEANLSSSWSSTTTYWENHKYCLRKVVVVGTQVGSLPLTNGSHTANLSHFLFYYIQFDSPPGHVGFSVASG